MFLLNENYHFIICKLCIHELLLPLLATVFITISTGNENSFKQEEWNFFQVTHLYRHNRNCCCYLIMYQAYDFTQVIPSWKFNSLIKSIVAYSFSINELPVICNSWSHSRSYCLTLALLISDYYNKNPKFLLFCSHSEPKYTGKGKGKAIPLQARRVPRS